MLQVELIAEARDLVLEVQDLIPAPQAGRILSLLAGALPKGLVRRRMRVKQRKFLKIAADGVAARRAGVPSFQCPHAEASNIERVHRRWWMRGWNEEHRRIACGPWGHKLPPRPFRRSKKERR